MPPIGALGFLTRLFWWPMPQAISRFFFDIVIVRAFPPFDFSLTSSRDLFGLLPLSLITSDLLFGLP